MWSLVNTKEPVTDSLEIFGNPHPVKQYVQDVEDFQLDESILDEFPPTPAGSNPYLKYPPWEEYINSFDASEIPSAIPASWNPVTTEDDEFSRGDILAEFPCYAL